MIKFFGSKNQPEKGPKLGRGLVPTDKVKNLSEKGFSEPEIIDVLRKEGYSSEEIDSALTQALKIGITGDSEFEMEKPPTLKELQATEQSFQSPLQQEMLQEFQQPTNQMPQMPEQSMQFQQNYYPQEDYNTEELIESIVQERMGELDKKLTDFRAKYINLERKMSDLHNQLSVVSKSRGESEHAIISKIDSVRDNLVDMNAKVSSLEKAFKEALPALIESVRALTDLVGRLKREAA